MKTHVDVLDRSYINKMLSSIFSEDDLLEIGAGVLGPSQRAVPDLCIEPEEKLPQLTLHGGRLL
jgi:hypothetical protein